MSRSKKKSSNTGFIILGISFICLMSCIGIIFINLLGANPILSNSTLTLPPSIPLPTIIAQTASAAQAQTSAASSPTSLSSPTSTETLISTISVESTATIFIFDLQTNVAQPTEYIYLTNTPFVLSTLPPPPSNGGTCSCTADTLNCTTDFSTQASAQACFDYCQSVGAGDIHRLDGNNDGVACEDLP